MIINLKKKNKALWGKAKGHHSLPWPSMMNGIYVVTVM